jgi:gliding motility-associated-like protein
MDSIKIPGAGMSADFTANKKEFKLGETLLLQDYSTGGNSIKKWDWDLSFGDTVKNTSAQDVQKKYTKGGVKPIVLTIYDKNNCSDQFKQLINVIDDYDVPNFLTPNGDFINDSLVLFDSIFKYFSIHIYNRWGNSVYNLKNNKGTLLWNGKKQNDTPCEAGVYFYKLEGILEDGNALSKSGFVTLIHGAD